MLKAAAANRKGGLTGKIRDLKDAKQRAQKERADASKELRNAERRRRRLKKKAKELPPEDLLEIVALRSEAKNKQKAATSEAEKKDQANAAKAPQRVSAARHVVSCIMLLLGFAVMSSSRLCQAELAVSSGADCAKLSIMSSSRLCRRSCRRSGGNREVRVLDFLYICRAQLTCHDSTRFVSIVRARFHHQACRLFAF